VVAEPVTEKELPTTEVEEVQSPEPVEQPVVEDEVPEEAVANFLRQEKVLDDGTSDGNGDGTGTDAAGPDLSKLTPQQILDLGKQQGKSETQTEAQAATARYQNQQRVEGARNALNYSKQNLTQILTNAGLDANTVIQATQYQDQLHGAWNLVYQADVAAAEERARESFNGFVQSTAASVLGTSKGKGLTSAWNTLPEGEKSSAKFFEMFLEHSGYLSPKQAQELATKAGLAVLKKLPKEARDAVGFNPSSTRADTNTTGGSGLTYKQILKNPKLIDGLTDDEYQAIVDKG